jgi:hypothetical protein
MPAKPPGYSCEKISKITDPTPDICSTKGGDNFRCRLLVCGQASGRTCKESGLENLVVRYRPRDLCARIDLSQDKCVVLIQTIPGCKNLGTEETRYRRR